MLTTLLLTVLLAEATPARQPDAGATLPSGTPAATTPATRDPPVVNQKQTDNPVFPPLPDGTAGSVLDPGKNPGELDRGDLPADMSDIPLAPTGPAPPSNTPSTEKKNSGKTGGGASRVDSIR